MKKTKFHFLVVSCVGCVCVCVSVVNIFFFRWFCGSLVSHGFFFPLLFVVCAGKKQIKRCNGIRELVTELSFFFYLLAGVSLALLGSCPEK